MKPLYLEMESIGPFVNKVRIDLGSIEEGGLFLICGPTGSGKSFIFDAMCYALYGKTPSGREKNLKSDYSKVGDEPRIEFCFQLGEKRYLAERTLEHDAPKRDGGYVTRPEKASLSLLIPDKGNLEGYRSKVLASRKREVQKKAVEIIGLEMEQFSRVMMIPQGEFRELLKADTDRREGLLRKLFDSYLYVKVADEFEKRTKRLRRDIGVGGTKSDTMIVSMIETLSLDSNPGDGLTFAEWSQNVIDGLDMKKKETVKDEEDRHERWNTSRKTLEKAKAVYRTNLDLEEALKRKAELERKEKKDIGEIKRKLDLHKRASSFVPDLGSLDHVANDIKPLEKSTHDLMEREKKLKMNLDGTRKKID
ncbi:MAG: AAA family ATPase, partial [Candidatus Thermoplasmatota archaeon]|nr:AAA family ATPase [Candidatus Thermoplasmatota archaeon]